MHCTYCVTNIMALLVIHTPTLRLKKSLNSCFKCNAQYNVSYAPKQATDLQNVSFQSQIDRETKPLNSEVSLNINS